MNYNFIYMQMAIAEKMLIDVQGDFADWKEKTGKKVGGFKNYSNFTIPNT